MSNQVRITLRQVDPSPALEYRIRRMAAKLERRDAGILSCRVVVGAPPRHKRHGGQFVARLEVKVPRGEIIVNRDHHEDPYVALRDAFAAAGRQLEERARRGRVELRSHRSRAGAPAAPDE